jgi:5-methyltetrahydrofolate--homocysteine methyltransferase
MINSITAEKGRHEDVLPLAKEHGALLVALTVGPDGMPTSADDRVNAARLIVRLVEEYDIPIQNVYFDPVVYSVATSGDAGRIAIESVRRLKTEYPDAHITCGLRNISFGLPRRRVLNRTFLAMLIGAGLDAAILDPTEPGMMSTVLGAEAVVGRDEFCMNYIGAERAGRLN